MLHGMYPAVVGDYEMYLNVAELEIDQTCKDINIVDLWKICDILYNQMIKYNPTHHKYSGEANMRPATQNIQSTSNNRKRDAKVKIGRPSEEDVQLSIHAKKSKKPSIAEVIIYVCVRISHS